MNSYHYMYTINNIINKNGDQMPHRVHRSVKQSVKISSFSTEWFQWTVEKVPQVNSLFWEYFFLNADLKSFKLTRIPFSSHSLLRVTMQNVNNFGEFSMIMSIPLEVNECT